MASKNKSKITSILAILLALVLWQLFAVVIANHLIIASPLQVVVQLSRDLFQFTFYQSLSFSLLRILFGFLLGLMIGTLLAVLANRFPTFEKLVYPYLAVIKTAPVASIIILCLLWFGAKNISIIISLLLVLPIIYSNFLTGLRQTDEKLLKMAQIFRFSMLKKVRYIYLPQLKTFILSSTSLALGLAFKAGIAAEVISIPDGSIGERLYEAKIYLNTAELFSWTIVIIVLSIFCEKAFAKIIHFCYKRLER